MIGSIFTARNKNFLRARLSNHSFLKNQTRNSTRTLLGAFCYQQWDTVISFHSDCSFYLFHLTPNVNNNTDGKHWFVPIFGSLQNHTISICRPRANVSKLFLIFSILNLSEVVDIKQLCQLYELWALHKPLCRWTICYMRV